MTLKELTQLAEQSWEGCDGCDENDKNFFINGFITGYNRSKPDDISDEEIEKEASKIHGVGYYAFSEGAKWYREQQLKTK
jgi:hypothetical protein